MSQFPNSVPLLIGETLRDPKSVARKIISLQLPTAQMWEALVLVVLLSVITAQGSAILAGGYSAETKAALPGFFFSPVLLCVVQGVLMTLMVLAVHGIGRVFGGQGQLPDAIALVVWLQFVMVCLQIVQGISMLVLPGISGMLGLVGIAAFFYLLTQFVCVLHSFERAGVVFVGILASMMGIILFMSIILALLGVGYVEIPDV